MLSQLRFTLLIPLVALVACSLPANTTNTTNPSPTGNWANWQIQTGTSSTTPPTALTSPPTGSYLTGALQTQASQVTGIFQFDGGPSPLNFTGTIDSTTSVLSLASTPAYLAVQLTLPPNPTNLATGNFSVACAPPPPGGATCTVIALLPAAGAEIASVTGTYAGSLSFSCPPYTSSCPVASGTTTLTLTQSSTPNSNGAFPLAGTITFPSNTPFGSFQLSGFIQGEALTLSYCAGGQSNGPCIGLTGSTSPDAAQITITTLTYNAFDGIVTYTGTLTRQ